ncbi:hypothetical protein GCM10007989_35160 [Devosia pacifica]|uniref:Uncharacterized protein n=1 Tax=Devosia pacifica TaxID=1335967 RepID=A0A918VYY5_9HYPH|nr:hypothetical protein [Devosia pacifica]GHA36068.1 hypothetical protein GCM10007989_35160 [Devosia pacifica]
MPILLLILLAILIAQVGFWDAFVAVLGAAGMIILFVIILIAALGIAGFLAVRRMGRR